MKKIISKITLLTLLISSIFTTPALAKTGDVWKGVTNYGSITNILLNQPSTFLDLINHPGDYSYEVDGNGYGILEVNQIFEDNDGLSVSEIQARIRSQLQGKPLDAKTLTATYGSLLGVPYAKIILPDANKAVTSVTVDGAAKVLGTDYGVTAGVVTITNVIKTNVITITTEDGITYTVSNGDSSENSVTISSITDITKTINQNEVFFLPSTVET